MAFVKCEACFNNHVLTSEQITGLLQMSQRGELHKVVRMEYHGRKVTQVVPVCIKDAVWNVALRPVDKKRGRPRKSLPKAV